MKYSNLEPLTIAKFYEQLGFDENLVAQFRSGIERITDIIDDYGTRFAEIESSRDQSDAEREALAQGLTENTVHRLEQEKQRLGGYDQHMARVALVSDKEAQRVQLELQQVRQAHEETLDSALSLLRPAEDQLVQMAR